MTEHQKSIDSVMTRIADLGIKTIENVINDFDNDSEIEQYCDTSDVSQNNCENKTLSENFNEQSEIFKKKSSNRYLIQSYNYDVELQNWELIEETDGDYFVSGQLENKNWWNTSYVKHIDIRNDHLKIKTINNTVYRCFYTESLDSEFGRRIYF